MTQRKALSRILFPAGTRRAALGFTLPDPFDDAIKARQIAFNRPTEMHPHGRITHGLTQDDRRAPHDGRRRVSPAMRDEFKGREGPQTRVELCQIVGLAGDHDPTARGGRLSKQAAGVSHLVHRIDMEGDLGHSDFTRLLECADDALDFAALLEGPSAADNEGGSPSR